MSLLIVGSCSRATQGIVAQLAKQQLYQSITILDLLPTYDLHQRFYRLKQNLSSLNSNTQVNINKLINIEELASNINSHKDLLFVTHDYFTSVTSKTKLMEITAQLSKQVLLSTFRKMLSLPPLLSTIILEKKILKQSLEHLNSQHHNRIPMLPSFGQTFKMNLNS